MKIKLKNFYLTSFLHTISRCFKFLFSSLNEDNWPFVAIHKIKLNMRCQYERHRTTDAGCRHQRSIFDFHTNDKCLNYGFPNEWRQISTCIIILLLTNTHSHKSNVLWNEWEWVIRKFITFFCHFFCFFFFFLHTSNY